MSDKISHNPTLLPTYNKNKKQMFRVICKCGLKTRMMSREKAIEIYREHAILGGEQQKKEFKKCMKD